MGQIEWRRFLTDYDSLRQRVIGGVAWTIAQLYDSGYLLGGGTNGAAIARLSAEGDSLWLRRYPREEFALTGTLMEFCIAPDSNVIVASGSHILKLSIANGDIIWRLVIDQSVGNIEPVGDDGFFAAGYTGFWDNVYAVRIDSEGEMIWEREYEAEASGSCLGIAPSMAGGWCLSAYSGFGDGWPDVYPRLIRIDQDGDIIWERTYDDFGRGGGGDVVETADGGFAFTGMNIRHYYYLVRVDYSGEPLWITEYGNWGANDISGQPYSLLLMDDSGYTIGGFADVGCWLVRTEPDPVDLPFELEALAERYNFGAVPVDSVGLGEVALDNFGARYVFIDSLALTGDSSAFAVQMELPYRINPADTAYIPVGFSPDSIGAFAAALTFFYGDGQSVEVRLSGRGRSLAVPPGEELPEKFELTSVHPNPFNAQTRVTYTLPEAARVNLSVYDLSGRRVATLVDVEGGAGVHAAVWDAADLPAGVYLASLKTVEFFAVRKVMLVK